jgi:membrane protease subunit (stomatin/prohibitin family)
MSIFDKKSSDSRKSHTILSTLKNNESGQFLVWKLPEEDFNDKSVLIVNPGEEAIFVNNGIIVQTFSNGRYELSSENYPFIAELRNLLTGGVSTFNCKVYFIALNQTHEILWGTDSPIKVRDAVQKIVTNVLARGSYRVSIENAEDGAKLMNKLLGFGISFFREENLERYFGRLFQQYIKSYLTKVLSESNEELLVAASHMETYANEIAPKIRETLAEFGLTLNAFAISGMDVPDISQDPNRRLIEEGYAKQRELEIMGENYSKIKGVDILTNVSQNPSSGGLAGAGAGIVAGVEVAKSISKLTGSVFGDNTSLQTPHTEDDVVRLEKLKKMLDMQLISQEDYNKVKEEILKKMIG